MTPTELKANVLAIPDAEDPVRVAFDSADDRQCAALLNANTLRGPVPINELSAYAVTRGIIGACEAATWDSATPGQLRAVCITVTTLLRDDYRLTTADVDDPAFGAACDALISAGLLTAGQKAEMLALAANRRSLVRSWFGDDAPDVSANFAGRARNDG